MNLPTVKQLRYFLALSETLHFGHAAEKCFVSQSAFSNAIQELESTLDVRLVDRTNRRVALTPMGRKVAEQAAESLHSIEQLVESVSGEREPLTGELRLGVIPTIAPFLMPKALRKLRRAYPDLKLYLTEDQTAVLHDKLMHGEIDVALLALPFDLPGTANMTLFKDRFLLACRHGSKHLDPASYRFSSLDPGSVMLMQDGHCLRDHALDACKLRDTRKLNRFSASSLLSLVEMVEADLGITYLPELAADSMLLKGTKIELHPLSDNNYRTISLVWHKGSARQKEFELLGDFIKEHHAKSAKP